MNFDDAFDLLMGHEGGYANDSRDPGGETMFGVTARVARADGYTGDMRSLPRDRAKAIYRRKYWDAVRADELPPAIRFTLFDAAVNSGPSQAIQWMQRALSVGEDGIIGTATIYAISCTSELRLSVRLNAERLEFMTNLPTWGAFGKGWARRIAANLKALA